MLTAPDGAARHHVNTGESRRQYQHRQTTLESDTDVACKAQSGCEGQFVARPNGMQPVLRRHTLTMAVFTQNACDTLQAFAVILVGAVLYVGMKVHTPPVGISP